MAGQISSYPKVWALGSRAVERLFEGPVIIQEKLDGSQFSFGKLEGQLVMRSHHAVLYPGAVPKMFSAAAETAERIVAREDFPEGWVVRSEVLSGPHHNILTYDRAPTGNLAIYDIQPAPGLFIFPELLGLHASLWDVEAVPLLWKGLMPTAQILDELLTRTSFLGGPLLEGIVIKNYAVLTQFDHVAMAKYVRKEFKEKQTTNPEFKKGRASIEDFVNHVKGDTARWAKAVQSLREAGELEEQVRDIGKLITRVKIDFHEEMKEDIKHFLFKKFYSDFERAATLGLADWYKQELANKAMGLVPTAPPVTSADIHALAAEAQLRDAAELLVEISENNSEIQAVLAQEGVVVDITTIKENTDGKTETL